MISITFNCDTAVEALSELQTFATGMRVPAKASEVLLDIPAGATVTGPLTVTGAPPSSDLSADNGVKGDIGAVGVGAEPAKAVEEKPVRKPRTAKADKPVETPPAPQPEVAAQDDADEIAEVEADQPADEPEVFTLDTVRHAMGDYVRAFGAEFAQADIPALIGAPKVSAIPNTPEALQAATLAVRAAVANNPNGRAPVNAAA